ncbi:MAG: hypothetical protein HQ483_13225 [Rhodospirillales bacterium]|nr:hypothetical protein [Rhodospirillales bacterium]
MQKFLAAGVATLALFAVAGSAAAVDVVNRDDQMHEIIIDDQAGTTQGIVEILPGETLENISDTCELTIGESDAVAVAGDQVAMIVNGALQIEQK